MTAETAGLAHFSVHQWRGREECGYSAAFLVFNSVQDNSPWDAAIHIQKLDIPPIQLILSGNTLIDTSKGVH